MNTTKRPMKPHSMWRSSFDINRSRAPQLATAEFNRRGAAAVELAMVLPLLLLLTFAAVDFGRVIHAHIVVTNAARTAAEYGCMHNFTDFTRDFWEERVIEVASEEMQGLPRFDAAKLHTQASTVDDSDGLFRVTVNVTYRFETVVRLPGLPAEVQLSHSVAMRQIR